MLFKTYLELESKFEKTVLGLPNLCDVSQLSAVAKRGKSSRLAPDWPRLQRECQARES